jgi:hypothetical protein
VDGAKDGKWQGIAAAEGGGLGAAAHYGSGNGSSSSGGGGGGPFAPSSRRGTIGSRSTTQQHEGQLSGTAQRWSLLGGFFGCGSRGSTGVSGSLFVNSTTGAVERNRVDSFSHGRQELRTAQNSINRHEFWDSEEEGTGPVDESQVYTPLGDYSQLDAAASKGSMPSGRQSAFEGGGRVSPSHSESEPWVGSYENVRLNLSSPSPNR